jgi:hypothetical protein
VGVAGGVGVAVGAGDGVLVGTGVRVGELVSVGGEVTRLVVVAVGEAEAAAAASGDPCPANWRAPQADRARIKTSRKIQFLGLVMLAFR